ncbi:UDP-N-acetylgalactosamine-undecaprenyl-phosphate N-acetylgalactosaminephosphotransferase [bioreactor metagenome]|uniref:UDP-N-acetylgalactosamine-undecaprenyl-phosphate N-acetylgalactosaminephosphotransferase n=1 Tax=bioreactor metagenome TaxID=1076179 RepID=A0A644YYA1_9ZZZZ
MKKQTFQIFKRSIDILGSIVLLIIFSPIMLITMILVKASSPGPIFFKQKRVGKNSRQFWMYKFRSMYTGDNDKRLRENYPELWKKYKENGWKLEMSEDPRITPIGKKIRSLTIDEFPQLINVLKGDMSLIGPRAYREEELQEQEKKYPKTKKYINIIRSAKPGITGVWQTSGRNDISFEQRAKMDADYIKKQSFIEEITIIIKTPLSMFSRW